VTGLEPLFDHGNATLAEMVEEGAITASERAAMVVVAYPRRKRDVLSPFASNGNFQGLTLESFEMLPLQDAAWSDYERDGHKEALATKRALFFRSVFAPSLGSALARARSGDGEVLRTFGDHLEAGLKRRLAMEPTALHSLVQVVVLAKRDS
jgi:hypothetical protein